MAALYPAFLNKPLTAQKNPRPADFSCGNDLLRNAWQALRVNPKGAPMYVMRHNGPGRQILIELSPAEFAAAKAGDSPDLDGFPYHRRVSGYEAHRYVADGGHHGTALYLGEDRRGRTRVRYARDGS
jgi:hypothetical protein